MCEINFSFSFQNPNDTLFGNYHAYLCDARFEIVSRTLACAHWSSKYDSVTTPKKETNNNTKETKETDAQNAGKEQDSLISVCTSGYETRKTSDTSEKEPPSLTSLQENGETDKGTNEHQNSDSKHDSLTSIGESSDYCGFRYKTEEGEDFAEEAFKRSITKPERVREYDEVPLVRSWRASAESIIGKVLTGNRFSSKIKHKQRNCRINVAHRLQY